MLLLGSATQLPLIVDVVDVNNCKKATIHRRACGTTNIKINWLYDACIIAMRLPCTVPGDWQHTWKTHHDLVLQSYSPPALKTREKLRLMTGDCGLPCKYNQIMELVQQIAIQINRFISAVIGFWRRLTVYENVSRGETQQYLQEELSKALIFGRHHSIVINCKWTRR